MKLSDTEKNSAVWRKVQEHLESRLESHRKQNDGNLNADSTAKLRGRIAETKYVLSLAGPTAPQQVDDGE